MTTIRHHTLAVVLATTLALGAGLIPRPAAAVEDPVPLLFDPSTRKQGVEKLNRMPFKRAQTFVMRTLSHIMDDAEGRRILLRALANAGPAGRKILARVAAGNDLALSEDAYRVLARAGALDVARTDMLRRVKTGRPLGLALFCVEKLVDLKERKVMPLLKVIIEDEKQPEKLRVAAVRGLGRFGGQGVIRHLTLVYQSSKHGVGPESVAVQRALLSTLAVHGRSDDIVATLIDALRVQALWNTAVEALVSLGRRAIPNLRMVLELGDREVEPGVLAVLFRLGGIDVSRFVQMLTSTDGETRDKARWLLLAFPDPKIVPELVRLWEQQGGYPTREELLDLLVPYYGEEEVRTIFEEALRASQVELRAKALDVIAGMRDRSIGDDILGVAEDDRRPEIRVRAIRALVFLGIFKGRGLLERMLQFEALPVRKEAAWAIGWLGEARTSPTALKATRDYNNEELLPRAVHASARLTGKPVMENATPLNYDSVERFDVKEAKTKAGARTKDMRIGRESLKIVTLGAGDPLLVFSPLPGLDPAPVLEGLLPLATYRKVILFYRAGRQKLPPHKVNAQTFRWMLDTGRAVLDEYEADGPVEVLGWSLGAAWALGFCLEQPDRCKKLMLVSPMSLAPDFWATQPGMLRATLPPWLATDLDYLETMKDRFHPIAFGRYFERLAAPLYVARPERAVPLVQIDYPFHVDLPEAPFLEAHDALMVVARSGLPVSAIIGEQDPLGPDWSDRLGALAADPNLKVQIFIAPDAAHLVLYENAEGAKPFLIRALRHG